MAIVSDFVVIRGDTVVTIGDPNSLWQIQFDTTNRYADGGAFLIFNVRGLVSATTDVEVQINGTIVGTIRRYEGGDGNFWYTQMIDIGSGVLLNGLNDLQIQAVTWSGTDENNVYDDFYLKDVICFFKQLV